MQIAGQAMHVKPGIPPNRPESVLISTRLSRPPVRPEWITRSRLLDRLDEAREHRLTLLSAPPGFGKTVLVTHWLEKHAQPAAWLSLDPFDSDPESFVRYFVAAIEGASSLRFPETGALLATRQAPPFAYLCDVLVSELAEIEEPLWVVLDDYHTVVSEDVHRLLERLVPALSSALHLVVLTRRDPRLPLGNWRAQGWLMELRGRDLRFTPDEARSFFAGGRAVSLADSTIERLVEKAEGWIAGLRLMKLSLRETKDPEARARAFSGTDRLVADYLTDEVLAAQPPEIREFLATTAPLPRFCASLCDHLLAERPSQPSARETLTHLEHENLLLVRLDSEGQWYRYHHLFQDLLLHRLPELSAPDRRADIGRRAGEWFAREGLVEEALRLWIDAGELDAAAALVGEHLLEVIDEDMPRRVLSGWVAMFPPGADHGRLPLLVARGYLGIVNWDLPNLAEHVAAAEACLPPEGPGTGEDPARGFRADVHAQKAFLLYWRGDAEGALQAASRALELLPPRGGGVARTLGLLYKAGGLAMNGRRSEALEVLEEGITEGGAAEPPRVAEPLVALAGIHLYAGDLASADAQVRRALAVHETKPFSDYWMGQVLYMGAAVAYERNQLDEAAAGFRRMIALQFQTSTRFYQEGLIGLCLVAKARGDREEARRLAAEARSFALQVRDPTALRMADSLEGRLTLGSGAVAPSTSPPPATQSSTSFWLEVPSLTWAERLLDDPSLGGPDAALAYVEPALEEVETRHNVRLAIPFSLLRAMALDSRGDQEAALAALETTVRRAEPHGFVRAFVDRGPHLTALLEELGARVARGGYLATLLSACRGEGAPRQQGTPAEPQARPGVTPVPGSLDALSNREMQVLELLADRLSNKEIAERLNISADTVKNHTVQIYGKLDVHSRRQAVAKGLADGLIPPRAWPPPPR